MKQSEINSACKTLANFNPNTEVLFASHDAKGNFHCSTRYKFVQAILEFLGCLCNVSKEYNNKKTLEALAKFTKERRGGLIVADYSSKKILEKMKRTFTAYGPQLPTSEAYMKMRNPGTQYAELREEYCNPRCLLEPVQKNIEEAMKQRENALKNPFLRDVLEEDDDDSEVDQS